MNYNFITKQLVLIIITICFCSNINAQNLIASLNNIKDHIAGNDVLTSAELVTERDALLTFSSAFENNEDAIELAFEVVEIYDDAFGALFTSGTSTSNGIRPRTRTDRPLENVIYTIMQSVIDHSFTEDNLKDHPSIFNNSKFATSGYFPGAVNPPSDPNVSYTVRINGKHLRSTGSTANYETQDARRPTGCYLAPGSVAKVTVPISLVGIGASVLVGAHTWDNSNKPNIRRLDRVTKQYEINSSDITIGNPLGGGIYINIPFEVDLGILDVTLSNVVRSPYFANTIVNQTSASEWRSNQRGLEAPWTDFETEKVMFQVPTAWIYAVDDPSAALDDWDLAMDAISDMLGRPKLRSKTVAYSQVDLQIRAGAFAPGYPQADVIYDPNTNYNGNHNHFLVQGPRNIRTQELTVFFHELGHGERIYKFSGEIESFVNFLWVPVYDNAFGVDLETAFEESSTTVLSHTIDEAAVSWMIAENFRLGNPMSAQTGQFRQEFHYQPRGHAKYADIVRLFGWEAIKNFYQQLNDDIDTGVFTFTGNVNNDPTDERIVRMSVGAGVDLRPLLHFWGIHPLNPTAVENQIIANGLQESQDIYDQLMRYKTIVPMNNAAFRSFGLNDYSENRILNSSLTNAANVSQSYYESFLHKFWDDYDQEEGQAAVDEIQNIIDLYFDGPPIPQSFIPDPDKSYYIDAPYHNLRLAATGESENPYATSTTTTGVDVEWKFVDRGNGFWHIQRADGGTLPRLRTDGMIALADMQATTSSAEYTYYEFTEGDIDGTHFITLPDGPASFQRLQMRPDGEIRFVTTNAVSTWVSWEITPVPKVVQIRKRNALEYAIDGGLNSINGQNVHLWSQNPNNLNQQWLEICHEDGYFIYQKLGTDLCIDGGDGGENRQNVELLECDENNHNQQWQKLDTDSGFIQLRKRSATDFGINGGNAGDNAQNVNLFDSSNPSHNLQWIIEELSDDCVDELNITGIESIDVRLEYTAQQSITSDQHLESGANATYTSNEIALDSNFTVEQGAVFTASIGGCEE